MVNKPGEFELISRILAPLTSGYPGSFNLTDDAAVLAIKEGREVVVTSDTVIEGVHFLPEDPPDRVGAKVLAVNLSDLAAMGAKPYAYTLAAAFSSGITRFWIERFAAGLKEFQQLHQIHLIGGDTVSTPGPLTLTVTAFGLVETGKSIRRSTANIGDILYVTGNIGDAALGLQLAKNQISCDLPSNARTFLIERYQIPTPRINVGRSLHKYATSAIDISDGLIADIQHIAKQSNRRIIIHAPQLPVSAASRQLVEANPELMNFILGGGDDYELAFTAPPNAQSAISKLSVKTGVKITAIGDILEMNKSLSRLEIKGLKNDFIDVSYSGYTHF